MKNRKTVVLDFDGVLHSYSSGWKGANVIPDRPLPGAIEALRSFLDEFDVAIFSSRSHQPGGIAAMRAWLLSHGLTEEELAQIDFPLHKPPAHVTIDDRAIQFNGEWRTLTPTIIREFQPWNRLRPWHPARA